MLYANCQPFCSGLNVWNTEALQQQIDGLVQNCSNSIANTLELLQSYAKPLKYCHDLMRSMISIGLFYAN